MSRRAKRGKTAVCSRSNRYLDVDAFCACGKLAVELKVKMIQFFKHCDELGLDFVLAAC